MDSNELNLAVRTVDTQPIAGQKPGTSGLRKKVAVFEQPSYLENFVQSVFNVIAPEQRDTLVIGGDGRYYNDRAIITILRMAIANGFKRLIVGQNGFLSTPAASLLIRKYKAVGGLVLSASHNPAGPKEDFGIKFNNASGSPAPESVTDAIYAQTQMVSSYQMCDAGTFDLARCHVSNVNNTRIEVVDSVTDYADLMAMLFDFEALHQGFRDGSLSLCFDAMHAITGPYAREIFERRLGAVPGSVINAEPLPDFGGGHPDPNLVHAKALIARMAEVDAPLLGAASDGDGDRNLIMGQHCFVSPSDSLAAIALNHRWIPQFSGGLPGVARSMPTSTALDRVAQHLGIPCFETPTGWKFFGNLLDAGKVRLCGEESFGTSGDHVREKDGIWAVLCWLSICLKTGKTPADVLQDLWQKTGRSFYCRHDYEGIDTDKANLVIDGLADRVSSLPGGMFSGFTVAHADVFSYRDQVDGSESHNQGIRVLFSDGSRVVFRLSGTGTDSATLRVYLELVQLAGDFSSRSAQEATAGLGVVAREISGLVALTGMAEPSVIT